MTINFNAVVFEKLIDNFQKTISKTIVTKSNNPLNDEEIFTDGAVVDINGAFFRKQDSWSQDKVGLFQNADAIIMVKSDVVLNKNDKLTYDNEIYRVQTVITRRYDGTSMHKTGWCFKI